MNYCILIPEISETDDGSIKIDNFKMIYNDKETIYESTKVELPFEEGVCFVQYHAIAEVQLLLPPRGKVRYVDIRKATCDISENIDTMIEVIKAREEFTNPIMSSEFIDRQWNICKSDYIKKSKNDREYYDMYCNNRRVKNIDFLQLTKYCDEIPYYLGGMYGKARFITEEHHVFAKDIKSAYSYISIFGKLPNTEKIHCLHIKNDACKFIDDIDNYFTIFKVKISGLVNIYFDLPSKLTIDGIRWISNQDYYWMKNYCSYEELEIIEGDYYSFNLSYNNHGNYRRHNYELFKKKDLYEKGDLRRDIAKRELNVCSYGSTIRDPFKYLKDDCDKKTYALATKNVNNSMPYPLGMYIVAAQRLRWMNAFWNNRYNFRYGDTDSMYYVGEWKDDGLGDKETGLGIWEDDGAQDFDMYIKQPKRYLRIKDGEVSVTFNGALEKDIMEAIKDDTVGIFKTNFTFMPSFLRVTKSGKINKTPMVSDRIKFLEDEENYSGGYKDLSYEGYLARKKNFKKNLTVPCTFF